VNKKVVTDDEDAFVFVIAVE